MNLRYGRNIHFGRHVWASPVGVKGGSANVSKIIYLPGLVEVISYKQDGTQSAVFGSDTEESAFSSISFELIPSGCGKATLKFRQYPAFDQISYGQRIDIHLYGDSRPWWSGYVLTRPDAGGTQNEYEITCHGFFNALKNKIIFARYQGWEISRIAADICRQAEPLGVIVNPSKIYSTSYAVSDILFDGVDAQKCLEQLAEFAADWVYGVDEYREAYFKPRVDSVNEEARFWAGEHLREYIPSLNVDKIVNWAKIKGAKINEETGDQWLATVEDVESQNIYGRREEVWTLPAAYSAEDAGRWGREEISRYRFPIESAKAAGITLEYPKPGGEFHVRKLSTDGQAAITGLGGEMKKYPITKLKYTIDANKGISCDMELGEQPDILSDWMKKTERESRNNELLQQASNKQLKQ
jgi:hypothetical protein